MPSPVPEPKRHPAVAALEHAEETPALPGDAESIADALAESERGETITTAELLRRLDDDEARK
jgi:hypothetical protein